ncbi:MAG TPA: hypothetical protein VFQ50_07660, partial [Flavobacterium sp.]|nr:hypothetical protein [Flavobacterium sp.]
MKKTLLLLALLASAAFSHAQKELSKDYSYTVSAPYKVFDAEEKLYFFKDGQIMTVKIDDKEIMIQKLNAEGEKVAFVSEKLFETKKLFQKNFHNEGVLEFDNKYFYFYSSWDGDNDKEQLFCREIDFATSEFGAEQLLFRVDGKVTGTMVGNGFSMEVQDKFRFLLSADNKKMMIQYRKKPEVKGDKKSWDIIGVNAYDSNMKQVWSNELKMPYT